MARHYWTCPNCGANLDHGEKCDCQENKKDEKKVIKTLKESEIDREIRLAKEEKKLNKKVNSLMETLDISEGEEALLTLKYCETAEMLREFDYKKNIFESLKESKNYKKINELNETVNTAKNKIYSTDIEVVTEGYRELAKVYLTLNEDFFFEKEDINREVDLLLESIVLDEKTSDERFYDKYTKKMNNMTSKAGSHNTKKENIFAMAGIGGLGGAIGVMALAAATGFYPIALGGIALMIPGLALSYKSVSDTQLTAQMNPVSVGGILGYAIENFKEYKNLKLLSNELGKKLDLFKNKPSDSLKEEIKNMYKNYKKEFSNSKIVDTFRKAVRTIFNKKKTTKFGFVNLGLGTTSSATISGREVIEKMEELLKNN